MRPIRVDLIRTLCFHMVKNKAQALEPAAGLKLLFSLDNDLYNLQGQLAIEYGHGDHTKHRHMRYHEFFSTRISGDDRVLDLGCGTGVVSQAVAAATGAQVIGIDWSRENIEKANNSHACPNVKYFVGDALEYVPDGKFSVVILSNVLEHIKDREKFLERIKGEITPEKLLIRVPLFERDWRVPLKQELGVEWRLDATHETEYTLKEFDEEVRSAGFEVAHIEVRWGEIWAEVRAIESANGDVGGSPSHVQT